ncbi:cytochrome c oxidase cbb3-type subunit 3 [Rubricella aquisinus]|uniref:Cbb3-type cytochrome c oxidase subunit n=1 Tax=Rubricella aquisinus TaxID=2028108 RepID=A0A840X118_9RHOB|nr:cytochrome-c oxidase, cbb3-type subunit III [Rubricella aquisinus]MBB5516414.1 cytochrome c oxidase cbb3-type subunit 3 [Rubricella aquisinus]
MAKRDDDDYPTTGHEWDGIREYDKPMPRWWVWCFYATIVFAIGYTIAYPAWPGITGATQGVLGYSTRGAVAEDIARYEAQNAGLISQINETELSTILETPELLQFANAGGAAVFRNNCSQCHGAGAAGAMGYYPNLLDDDWLWGGEVEQIHQTIAHGIRWDEDWDTRLSMMPAFGVDGILNDAEIEAVADYVISLSSSPAAGTLGETLYLDNCAACHMDNGMGEVELGAPNLTDAIWLYGGDKASVVETITYSRAGVMPAWADRLSEAEVKQVAVYVHSLGGGQ